MICENYFSKMNTPMMKRAEPCDVTLRIVERVFIYMMAMHSFRRRADDARAWLSKFFARSFPSGCARHLGVLIITVLFAAFCYIWTRRFCSSTINFYGGASLTGWVSFEFWRSATTGIFTEYFYFPALLGALIPPNAWVFPSASATSKLSRRVGLKIVTADGTFFHDGTVANFQ